MSARGGGPGQGRWTAQYDCCPKHATRPGTEDEPCERLVKSYAEPQIGKIVLGCGEGRSGCEAKLVVTFAEAPDYGAFLRYAEEQGWRVRDDLWRCPEHAAAGEPG
jgi:hypothetical protein